MSRIPTILSVDWDYFLPFCTDRKYDWGHGEGDPIFYELIWHARAMPIPVRMLPANVTYENPVDAVRVDPDRTSRFWNTVLAAGYPRKVSIQDSHGKIPEFLKQWDKVNLINFDAHHDAGYNQVRVQDCSNWAHFLRKQGKLHDYTLVYPKWRKQEPESHIPKHVDRVIYGDWPNGKIKAVGVFACRSSCWMPPWCDPEWMTFRETLIYRGPITGVECEYVTTPRKWTIPTIAT